MREFSPIESLKKRRDFLRVQSSRVRHRSKNFLLSISPRNDKGRHGSEFGSRVGITITTKIDKRAVMRNRLRRRVREFFRLRPELLPSGLDMVVIALNGATELDHSQIVDQLIKLVKYANKP